MGEGFAKDPKRLSLCGEWRELQRFMQDGGLLSCRPFSPFSAIAANVLRAACSIAQPLAFQVFLHIGEDQFVLTCRSR